MSRAPYAILLAALAACAAPAAEAPPAPTGAAAAPAGPRDDSLAREALDVALKYLGKRNFDVKECAPGEFEHASEAAARAGKPIEERCTMLVAHLADGTWLVSVRAATTASPNRAGGGLGLVTVTKNAEGVKKIEYGK
jgi:hypothetical protein